MKFNVKDWHRCVECGQLTDSDGDPYRTKDIGEINKLGIDWDSVKFKELVCNNCEREFINLQSDEEYNNSMYEDNEI